MEKFNERLKYLRQEKGLSQNQLAKETGLSQSGITLLEAGKRLPTSQTIIILANYFEVSTDYILGLID